ncbi:beta-propeller fold lactonase family protein [Pararobbsia silviterrae]|uniref:beta-propeller fold lactonase family protein n=1 Tax=Pararobbsia silviterrae TaxID=1792498 RepID=UPI00131449CA|nr:beta-propeller fold lactonase family protein [Pararobbsia silviterrae]
MNVATGGQTNGGSNDPAHGESNGGSGAPIPSGNTNLAPIDGAGQHVDGTAGSGLDGSAHTAPDNGLSDVAGTGARHPSNTGTNNGSSHVPGNALSDTQETGPNTISDHGSNHDATHAASGDVSGGSSAGGHTDSKPGSNAEISMPPGFGSTGKDPAHVTADSGGTPRVRGTVEGLAVRTTLKLFNRRRQLLTIRSNGDFEFDPSEFKDNAYHVSVAVQPRGQVCHVAGGTGDLRNTPRPSVTVQCMRSKDVAITALIHPDGFMSFTLDAETGAMNVTPSGRFELDRPARHLRMTRNGEGGYYIGSFLHERATNLGLGEGVRTFRVDRSTGALLRVTGANWQVRSRPFDYVLDPTADRFFVVEQSGRHGVVSGVPTSSNFSLLEMAIPQFDAWIGRNSDQCMAGPFAPFGHQPREGLEALRITPDGRHAYQLVCNNITGYKLLSFSIDRNSGRFSPFEQTFNVTGLDAYLADIEINPQGTLLFATHRFQNFVHVFRIDDHGILSPVEGSPFEINDPLSKITMSHDGEVVYFGSERSFEIDAYRIDPSNGALTPVAGAPFWTGVVPMKTVINASQTFAYVATERNVIRIFAIDPITRAFANAGEMRTEGAITDIALSNVHD